MNKTKELNNKHKMIIKHTSEFGKETTFVLKVQRERVYNQCLGVERLFSNEHFLKALSFPTNHLNGMIEFGHNLDAITYSSSPYS